MEIVTKKIREMERAAYNPRVTLRPGDIEYENLQRSITDYGLIIPVIWNRKTNRVVSGHQRLTVLENLGEKLVDVSVVDLDEMQEKQLVVALNKIEGKWDDEKLSELVKELGVYAPLTGLSQAEIALLSSDIEEVIDSDRVDEENEGVEGIYNITLTFDMADKADITDYIRENGKTPLVEAMLDKMRERM